MQGRRVWYGVEWQHFGHDCLRPLIYLTDRRISLRVDEVGDARSSSWLSVADRKPNDGVEVQNRCYDKTLLMVLGLVVILTRDASPRSS